MYKTATNIFCSLNFKLIIHTLFIDISYLYWSYIYNIQHDWMPRRIIERLLCACRCENDGH